MLKNIFLTFIFFFFCFLFLTKHAFASTLHLSPSSGTIGKGNTLTVQVRINTAGEAVNAVSAFLSYPASKLDVAWVSGGSAFSIEAEKSYGGGSIRISRGSITGASGNLNVASIGFRAKQLGSATVTFVSGSAAPRASDSSDSLSLGASTGGTYTIIESQKIPQEKDSDSTAPTISNVSATSTSTTSAVVKWETDENANSLVEYGYEKDKYFFSTSSAQLVTQHTLLLEGSFLVPGTKYHLKAVSKDASGNLSSTIDTTVVIKGYMVTVKVVDYGKKPLSEKKVILYTEPLTAITGISGEAHFSDVSPGKHLAVVKVGELDKTEEIYVKDEMSPQTFVIRISNEELQKGFPSNRSLYLVVVGIATVAFFVLAVVAMRKRRNTPPPTLLT